MAQPPPVSSAASSPAIKSEPCEDLAYDGFIDIRVEGIKCEEEHMIKVEVKFEPSAAPVTEISQAQAVPVSAASSPALKTEPCSDGVYDVTKEINVEQIQCEEERSLLYAEHEFKEEMVIGPTEIHRPEPVTATKICGGGPSPSCDDLTALEFPATVAATPLVLEPPATPSGTSQNSVENPYTGDIPAASSSSQSPVTFNFVESKRGGKILWRGGYRYRVNKYIKSGSVWRCTTGYCKAVLTINLEQSAVIRETPHTCLPDFNREKLSNVIDNCRKRVRTDSAAIPEIYEKESKKLKTADFVDELPSFSQVKDQMYRSRNKFNKVSKACNFKNMSDIELSESVRKDFLLIDDGKEERILCFVSLKGRDALKQLKYLLLDGTFASSPGPCAQIYTIHGDLSNGTKKNQIVPIIFALLPNKTQQTYERLFGLLKNAIPEFAPTNFKIDFEVAAINAIQSVFPAAHISGCFFHYSKALWKKADETGLIDVAGGKKYVRMCAAVAHLPITRIPEAWLHLIHFGPEGESVTAFQGYMSSQWMGKNVSLISCYGQMNRTTNPVGGWHNRLNWKVGKCSSMLRTIDILKSESSESDFKIDQWRAYLEVHKTSPKEIKVDQRINSMIGDYLSGKTDMGTLLELLSNVRFEVDRNK